MSADPIEEFAKNIMESIRDRAIRACDMRLNASSNSIAAKQWRAKSYDAKFIIPDCVDSAIFFLLDSIDQGIIGLKFASTNGLVDLTEMGGNEMAGSFAGDDWRSRFSKERFNEDREDPDLD